jgi:hypothetical protein
MREPTPSHEAAAELRRMREDAERYRFWRRILLRRPERHATGAPIYSTTLETPADIDADGFDLIIDVARRADNGETTSFGTGFLADEPAHEPEAEPPVPEPAPVGPMACGCGAVRPPTRGRRPATWTCDACVASGVHW